MSGAFRNLTPTCWVAQSSIFATNTGLFLAGGEAYLVDPGIAPAELDAIEAFVIAHGAVVRGILLTHAHWDHLLGPSRFPSATVIAHAAYGAVVRQHGADLQRQVMHWRSLPGGLEKPQPFTPPRPDLTFQQRLVVHLGTLSLIFLHAPGHSPDHCVVYEPSAGLLWAGDMLSDIEVPMPMGRFSDYLATLHALSELEVTVLVPGHGTPTDAPDVIRGRFAQDQAYLGAVRDCASRAVDRGASLVETLTGMRRGAVCSAG